jgi:predicted DNA-binding transcriptional regulator YafY
MPPLLLDEEEAIAVAVGLRTAARASVAGIEETSVRALVKLEQVLPQHLRRRVAALASATIAAPAPGGPVVDPQHLTTIAAGCRDAERLTFAYRSRDGTESRREVEPHSLVNLGRRWYLVAWDRRREDWRTFRIDRIERPAATGVRFPRRELPGGDPARFVEQRIAGGTSRYEARITLHEPAESVAARLPWLASALVPLDAERCEYRSSDDDLRWLALRVVALDAAMAVDGSPELASLLRGLGPRRARAPRSRRCVTPGASTTRTSSSAPGPVPSNSGRPPPSRTGTWLIRSSSRTPASSASRASVEPCTSTSRSPAAALARRMPSAMSST